MKALVTGGTGFVGRYLVRELASRGVECRVLVRPTSDRRGLADVGGVEYHEGDILRPETLAGVADGVRHVYHLAAEGHVSAVSKAAFRKFVEVNVEGTRNLLSACSGCGVETFVHFSSTAAMGLITEPLVSEATEPRPRTPYQRSKLESERIAFETGRALGVSVVALRPCMVYGVNGRGEFFKMCRLMRKGLFPRVGFGRNLTPLVHVRDVVRGAALAAENGRPGEVYLIASERSIELAELRRFAMEAWGVRRWYPYVPVWFMHAVAWCCEATARVMGGAPIVTRRNVASTVWDREFSIEKAMRELGYEPAVSFREGILETVRWFESER